ncbi:MAG TPA: histidinol-phosphate transaminase [Terriglobales bacterium]|nr:histidinol-phosphate transaminase [Terriglobales bacterium]
MLKPRPCIEAVIPYSSPILSRDGLCLDLNENAMGCSPRVLDRLRNLTTEEIVRYPRREDGECLVANFLRVAPDQVLLTNGMDDALALIFSAYLGPDDELIFADPTFVMYPMLGQACGASIVRLQSDSDLRLPVASFLQTISPRTRLIVIANPNNPTGLPASRADLLRIVEAAPHAAVLIDEAYYDFLGETLMNELSRHPNLFVARTFSKAYGLAGLRLGVLIGAPEQIGFIRRFCPPFNVNAAALACLEAALEDQDFIRDYIEHTRRSCRAIESVCRELGLHFWPSSANFVLVRIGEKLKAFVAAMHSRGIVVRDMSSNPGCEACARITAATDDQMDKILQAIRDSILEVRTSGVGY